MSRTISILLLPVLLVLSCGKDGREPDVTPVPYTPPDTPQVTIETATQVIALAEQNTGRYLLYDIPSKTIVWSWFPSDGGLSGYDANLFHLPDEVKPVMNRTCLLVTASGGGVALIRVSDKKILFKAAPMGNPHSAELLPDGNIAVACSDGNKICIYRPDDAEPAFTLDLDYAHNVVWDKERQLLWSASMGMVYSFKYLVGEDGPRLELDSMTPCPASVTEAHELSPVYGKPALYVSFAKGVFRFDCVTKTFTEEKVPNDTGVKSLTEGPSGYPLTVLRATSSWWSPELHTVDGGLLLYESSFHLYKARWFVDNPFSYKYE